MFRLLASLLGTVRSGFRTRAALQFEVLALRQQINVLRRSQRGRVRLRKTDRIFWTWLPRLWQDWRSALVIVKPETVIAWHRRGFRLFWSWKSRHRQPGRPELARDTRELIRRMSRVWSAIILYVAISQALLTLMASVCDSIVDAETAPLLRATANHL